MYINDSYHLASVMDAKIGTPKENEERKPKTGIPASAGGD